MHHTLPPSPTQHPLEALSLCIWTIPCVLDLREKGEGPENPYGVVDRSYANFGELRKGEVRRIYIPRTSVNRGKRKVPVIG
jgi:hypothetical protein